MTRQRHWGLILAAVALVAALVWGFMPRPVPVDVAAVSRAPLRVTIEEEGRTRVIDRYVVSAPVAGYARRIDLRVGDTVSKGEMLVDIEPLRSTVLDPRSRAEAEARMAAAQAAARAAEQNLRAAAADAEMARREFARREALALENRIAREERDRAEAAMQRSEAVHRSAAFALEVARYELQAAQAVLQHSAARSAGEPSEQLAVNAPVNGRVLGIPRKSEGVVASGQALIEIGDPRALEVEVEVLSADAVRILPGMAVEFTRWGGGDALQGVVRTVEPTGFTKISALGVEEQRVLVIADIRSPADAWSRLGDGYRVEASFVLWQDDDVLQIPASALFRHDGGWAVFSVTEGRAQARRVTVGHNNGFAAEILEGLEADEQVIVHPSDAVDDGVRVVLR